MEFVSVLPLVGIALLFWLLLVRPQARRRRELSAMHASLEVGDEVILTSGVYGTLRSLDDDTVLLEIAEGLTIKVARGAVGEILTEKSTDQLNHEMAHQPAPDPVPDEVVGSEEN